MSLPPICSKHNSYLYLILFLWLGCLVHLKAQSFDQSYAQWKRQQQEYDSRLTQKSDQYYLARPTEQHITKPIKSTQAIINLNRADIQQLQSLHGVGRAKAQAIIEYRQKNGGFKQIEELTNVKGIGPKLLEKNKARLSL